MTGIQTAKPQLKQLKPMPVHKRKAPIGKIIIYLVLSLWAITTMYPFFWVIINSFKKKGLIRSDSFSIPIGDSFSLDNYRTAFERVDILGAYKNSLIISISVTLVVVLLAGFAAYGLSRYNFKGKNAVYSLIVASMMFPVFSTIIPVFRMMFSWKIANTGNVGLSLFSVILPQIAGNLAFSIIVLMGFIKSLPIDLEEAAFMEGCNIFQIFFRIIVPITKPSFATVAIFTFLWSYNDLFTQMFFLRYKESYTITLLLNEISSQAGVNYGLMTAAVVLVVVPVLIVYIFLQKNIIKGMTAGAIKG
ncbi:raffinose/stachyose/melibiose transport system permease protein [Hydrogenoanaerobacterium saccharovorans]|uniref:Raffinose/stachyose/melibiose transport system permease protein n=1 Tax=Hydrogenoanaerobacterium saccharovorans TaxID=474960 RepID=A0A1H8DVF1_9FIRM|nr:raffinose/stachyose/melibiose transport system permease protein [Hydrogenoanaerobacterium saccharovorans]SEN10508.1 raffinose/stachyose/melibiose transport system permease protein [Hydrogenoanaerobacterium saccharovorans]